MGSKKRVKDPFLFGRIRNKQLDDLRGALLKESIDRQSYDEIYNMLTVEARDAGLDDSGILLGRDSTRAIIDVQKKLKEASEYFSKAVEGTDPKFKARRKTELLYKTITDQPGRRQFVFGPNVGRTSESQKIIPNAGSFFGIPNVLGAGLKNPWE